MRFSSLAEVSLQRLSMSSLDLQERIGTSQSENDNRPTEPAAVKRVLLIGFFGAPNFGDEAVALAGIRAMQENKEVEAIVATSNPALTSTYLELEGHVIEGRYGNCQLRKFVRLSREIKAFNAFVFPGGGILQDVHSLRLLHQSALYAAAACYFNIPYSLIGVGIGPFRTKYGKRLAQFVLKHAQRIVVRDESSLKEVRGLYGIPEPELGCDSAFGLCEKTATLPIPGVIGLAFRHWPGLDAKLVCRLIEQLRKLGKEPRLFVCEPAVDRPFYEQICRGLDTPIAIFNPTSVEGARKEIATYEGLISMRLHPLIFAMQAGVPISAVSYDPKIDEVMRGVGLEKHCFPLAANEGDLIASLIGQPKVPESVLAQRSQAMRHWFKEAIQRPPTDPGLATKLSAGLLICEMLVRSVLNRAYAKVTQISAQRNAA